MYDLDKLTYVNTVGELRMILDDLPDEAEVCAAGAGCPYVHITKDKSVISLDDDMLFDAYPELDDDSVYDQKDYEMDKASYLRIHSIEEGPQFLLVGNKLMRTFLADDGSWDYELYSISLSVADSGQIGENRNMTRKAAIDSVLSWNNLSCEKRKPVPFTEALLDLTECQNEGE